MQHKFTFLLPLILFSLPSFMFAQIAPECGFDGIHQKKLDEDAEYRKATKKADEVIYDLIKNGQVMTREALGTVHTIPVVVHVMHLPGDAIGTGSNISDAQIQAGIDHLNDAYRNIGTYAGGPFYSNAGIASADVEIEFCLAVRDPSGNATTGINRVSTTYSNLDRDLACSPPSGMDTQDDCLKALSFWDSNDYMNVWIVNEICTGTTTPLNCGVAGYAYYSSAHGATYDGVVNEAGYWGSSANNSKVHIHEVGHYLNLRHTFEGGCSETDCLIGGDKVCDTPPDNSTSSVSCASGNTANTCSNDASITNSPFVSDVQDIYENYMDYGFQSCQNTFTPGQVTRMRLALTTTRASLLTSMGCVSAAAPISDFTSSNTEGCPGTAIVFQDNSINGTSSWSWSFPGGTPSSSSIQNPTVTYNTAGSYNVTLIASNGIGTGTTETKINHITIYSDPTTQCSITSSNANTTGDNYGFGIKQVTLEDINNATGATVAEGVIYVDYTCSNIAFLDPGTVYSLTIGAGSFNPEDIRAYIDFNNDGDFLDTGEDIFSVDNVTGGTTSQNFTTSGFPVTNTLLTMRVVSDWSSVSTPSSCLTPTYGQVEDYGIYFASAALPISLTSFTAKQNQKAVQLNWQTASETDNDYFTLEYSTDGIDFKFLTKVATKGNGSTQNNYRHLHEKPVVGANYYRLSQTDLDGTHEVVGIKVVTFKSDEVVVAIEPNPVRDNILNLKYTSPFKADVEIEIIDMTGRILLQNKMIANQGLNHFELPMNNLSNGVYFLRTKQAQNIQTIRFVKAR